MSITDEMLVIDPSWDRAGLPLAPYVELLPGFPPPPAADAPARPDDTPLAGDAPPPV